MRTHERKLTALTTALLAGVLLAGCGSGAANSATGANGQSTQLTIATTAGPLARNFNPFLPTSVALTDNVVSFIYEPLLQYNPFKPKAPMPWLATSWSWSNGEKTLTMNLRKGVKWSDGTSFSSADVAGTFNLLKKYPATNTNGIDFKSVTAQGPDRVVFQFAKPGFSQFYLLSSSVYIVPDHIWSKIGNPVKYADPNPVGTGPYVLTRFSTQGFLLKRNPHFWQPGKPVISALNFPSYNGNGPANVAVESGQSTWSGQYIPNIKRLYLDRSSHNHAWSPATSQVALVPNVSKFPLNDLAVRKAISDALNRQDVAAESESGQATAVTTATGIVANESQFIAPQYKNDVYRQNVSEAKALLAQDGWKPGTGGVLQKNGKPLNLTLTENSGFTDYMTGAQVIAQELKAVGMHVTVSGVSNNAWTSDLADGNFQLTTDYSNSEGIDPEVIYQGWLDSSLIHNGNAGGDFGRWQDAKTESYFNAYRSATSDAARNQAIVGMEGILVNDLPVIPLYGGPDWTQYNDEHVVGWPSPSNPYDVGAPFAPNNEVVVLRLTLRK